jgi:hypothetical protein
MLQTEEMRENSTEKQLEMNAPWNRVRASNLTIGKLEKWEMQGTRLKKK